MSERIRIEDEVVVATIRAAISAERRRPRYEVLIDTIAQLIRDGQLEPGASLPTEPQLAIDLGISRTTIRHAFDELAQRGIIVRRRGVGTFVTSPAVEQPLGQMSSFVKTLASQRDDSDSRLLGVRLTVHAVASTFLFGSEDRIVFEISRLFVVDEDPFALERIYLPTEIGELLPVERIRSAVIDDLIREMAGIAVDHGYETIELAKLDREQAALLGARRGDAAFLITRMVSSAEQPLQVRQTLIRGERVRFHIGLQGPDLAPGADVGVLMSSNRQIT